MFGMFDCGVQDLGVNIYSLEWNVDVAITGKDKKLRLFAPR